MKTRRERRIDQWRVFGAFAFLFFAFIAMLTGCATVPGKGVIGDAEMCLQRGPCVVVQVTNDNWLDASVWINSRQMGIVNGLGSLTLFVPVSQLSEGGKCIVASFRPIGPHLFHTSNKECLQAKGGHFTLQFDSLSHVWLVPWVGAK